MKRIIPLIFLFLVSTMSSCDRSDMYKCWEFTKIAETFTYLREGTFYKADTSIYTECGLTVIDAEIKAKKGSSSTVTTNSRTRVTITFKEKN